jgi:hypothetical protein
MAALTLGDELLSSPAVIVGHHGTRQGAAGPAPRRPDTPPTRHPGDVVGPGTWRKPSGEPGGTGST